jgi:hypothetical protein
MSRRMIPDRQSVIGSMALPHNENKKDRLLLIGFSIPFPAGQTFLSPGADAWHTRKPTHGLRHGGILTGEKLSRYIERHLPCRSWKRTTQAKPSIVGMSYSTKMGDRRGAEAMPPVKHSSTMYAQLSRSCGERGSSPRVRMLPHSTQTTPSYANYTSGQQRTSGYAGVMCATYA